MSGEVFRRTVEEKIADVIQIPLRAESVVNQPVPLAQQRPCAGQRCRIADELERGVDRWVQLVHTGKTRGYRALLRVLPLELFRNAALSTDAVTGCKQLPVQLGAKKLLIYDRAPVPLQIARQHPMQAQPVFTVEGDLADRWPIGRLWAASAKVPEDFLAGCHSKSIELMPAVSSWRNRKTCKACSGGSCTHRKFRRMDIVLPSF